MFSRTPSQSVITGANKQKSFYEDLVQIGTKDDTGIGTADSKIAAECLREYMDGFQQRNPNFYVFNAVMHLDEATTHLHIDYIPIGHFERGLDTRNAMAKALEEMGFGKGKDAINRWRLSEHKVLENICNAHGIEISEPKKSRGYSFSVDEYKRFKDVQQSLNNEIKELQEKRDKIMHYKPDYDKTDRLQFEYEELSRKLIEMTSSPISIMRNIGVIKDIAAKMVKRLKSAYRAQRKSEDAQAEIIAYNNEIVEQIKMVEDSLISARETISALEKENGELKHSAGILSSVERIDSTIIQRAIDMIEREERAAVRKYKHYRRNQEEI